MKSKKKHGKHHDKKHSDKSEKKGSHESLNHHQGELFEPEQWHAHIINAAPLDLNAALSAPHGP